jgi:hypothetical protein
MNLTNYSSGSWQPATGSTQPLHNAITAAYTEYEYPPSHAAPQ